MRGKNRFLDELFEKKLLEVLEVVGYDDYEEFREDIYIEKGINNKEFESKQEEIDYLVQLLGYDDFDDFYSMNIRMKNDQLHQKKSDEFFKCLFFLIIIFCLIGYESLFEYFNQDLTDSGIFIENMDETEEQEQSKIRRCDGTVVINDCFVDGVEYSLYKYHSAVPEKSHVEVVTTYTKEIVGYCTLCNDGTRSPSCATGRGACSHHGGVAEWNAPIYKKVPHYEEKVVIDSPAIPEYWEKIVK